jgi:hypothetical protein
MIIPAAVIMTTRTPLVDTRDDRGREPESRRSWQNWVSALSRRRPPPWTLSAQADRKDDGYRMARVRVAPRAFLIWTSVGASSAPLSELDWLCSLEEIWGAQGMGPSSLTESLWFWSPWSRRLEALSHAASEHMSATTLITECWDIEDIEGRTLCHHAYLRRDIRLSQTSVRYRNWQCSVCMFLYGLSIVISHLYLLWCSDKINCTFLSKN